MKKGSCLCGAVSFVMTGALSSCDACYCVQCRKQSGHYFVGEGDYYDIADGTLQHTR